MPSLASSLKQMRHISNSRMYPRLRPQRKQRRTTLDANFGTFFDRAMVDVFAITNKIARLRASRHTIKSHFQCQTAE